MATVAPLDCGIELDVPPVPRSATPVLHVINGEHYSGAERVQDLLALRLPEFGYEVSFALLKPGKFASARRSQNAPLFSAAMNSRFDLGAVRRLAMEVKARGFHLIHTHTPRAALIGGLAARAAGVPVVHHVHSPTTADSTHRLRNYFNSRVERYCLRRAAAVVAVSNSLGQYTRREHLGSGRMEVIPNGVPVSGSLSFKRTPSGVWTIGCVALFRPRKGLEVLIQSLALAKQAGLPIQLLAVGGFETTEYEIAIRTQADRLGVGHLIQWTGFTREVAPQLAKMDLFALPSLFGEGLPMVVLEAMAAGVPVISTQVEGIPEAIRDGIDGLLVPPNSPQALTAAIAKFVRGEVDWQAMRASAHQRQDEMFSDVSMAQHLASLYDEVLYS